MPGAATSAVEVTNISRHGLWLLLGDEELFLPFEHFPWFRRATIGVWQALHPRCARAARSRSPGP